METKLILCTSILDAEYKYNKRLKEAHENLATEMDKIKKLYDGIATKDDLVWEEFVRQCLDNPDYAQSLISSESTRLRQSPQASRQVPR